MGFRTIDVKFVYSAHNSAWDNHEKFNKLLATNSHAKCCYDKTIVKCRKDLKEYEAPDWNNCVLYANSITRVKIKELNIDFTYVSIDHKYYDVTHIIINDGYNISEKLAELLCFGRISVSICNNIAIIVDLQNNNTMYSFIDGKFENLSKVMGVR